MGKIVLAKAEDGRPDQQLVYGEVYAPDRPDSQGDYMSAEEIQKTAYAFMVKKRQDQVDHQHDDKLVDGCNIVESFIARKGDPDFIEGSWVVGMHVDNPQMWEKIKKGEVNGFSLEAMATAKHNKVDLEIPPVVRGLTSKSEDHEHQFFVTYNDQGKFLGGTTSVDAGHSHVIKAGTFTETAAGHNHRFSAVDDLQISKD